MGANRRNYYPWEVRCDSKSGGVRIGTAEIYAVVDSLPEITESLVIGQRWDGDERVVLFVVLSEGNRLDDELREKN